MDEAGQGTAKAGGVLSGRLQGVGPRLQVVSVCGARPAPRIFWEAVARVGVALSGCGARSASRRYAE